MTIQFTMPVEQEKKYESAQTTFTAPVKLYKPRPYSAGQKFTNELFIPLFDPTKWSMFNKSDEDRNRLGLVDFNPIQSQTNESPLFSFYFKVPVHTIQKFVRDDGTEGFTQFICPVKFNEYLTRAMGRRPLFKESKCPFCEARDKSWAIYNKRWKEIEEELGIKKSSLDKKGRREISENDAILKESYYNATQKYAHRDSIVMNVFDLGKLKGTYSLDEGEELSYNIFTAPTTVFTSLRDQWEEDAKDNQPQFFSFDNPQGLQIVKLIKNTEECSKDDLRQTSYTVMKGATYAVDETWRGYLCNLDNMLDPSELLIILPVEDIQRYVTDFEENYNTPSTTQQNNPQVPVQSAPQVSQAPVQTPAQVPTQTPPQAPQAPAQSVPQVPVQNTPPTPQVPVQTPPQVPVQNTPQVPPTASGGAIPAMPTNAPVVPTVPVQTPPQSDSQTPATTEVPDRTPPQTPPGQNFSW